jgi:tRNA(Ile)-lysidine synthase
MSAVVETRALRRLRPLLAVPKARLVATLERLGQGWIEDPSNRDRRFGRVRVRARLRAAGGRGGRPRAGRAAREARVAALLAAAWVHPDGGAEADAAALAACDPALGRRALARLLICVGGAPYPPPTDKLDRLRRALADGALASARTLAGCRIEARGARLVVAPERGRCGVAPRPRQPLLAGRFSAV